VLTSSSNAGPTVLAVGIDAAESSYVRKLIDHDELPALKALLSDEHGRWLSVRSPAHIGSGAVWPTFMSATEPSVHGMYSEWSWRPETMNLVRYHGLRLPPFWQPLVAQGVPLGIFDVPFALPIGVANGFEVSEWWAHDSTSEGLQAGPPEILEIVRRSSSHPLSANRFVDTTPDNRTDLKELAEACSQGARLRGELAARLIKETNPRLSLLVFPEIHHASHQMWHTTEPHHPVYSQRDLDEGGPLLRDIFRAVDKQIARLLELAGTDATVLVFALHGMRPALGFPAFLGPLLIERGLAKLTDWRSQSWPERALSLLATVKRHTPDALKQLYYKTAPTVATHKLARPTMLPVYDWDHTRAFSLPTDQYGWIRINLEGRESRGSVPLSEYEETRDELEKLLLGLVNEEGQSLVADITRTVATAAAALTSPLPDLVVHWEYAAFAPTLQIKGSGVRAELVGKKSTGQHASEGFCIYRGPNAATLEEVVAAKDLGRLITAPLLND
jgi:predicted AlkP superfamily phosphohydrolase/phosphomutase